MNVRRREFVQRWAAGLWLAATLLCGVVRAAQAPEEGVAAKIARLRDPRLSIDDRDRLFGELLGLGEPGASALAKHSAEQVERAAKRAAGLEARYIDAFERATKKLIASRSTKAALEEVDAARSVVLKLREKPDLSKADIEEQDDPALAKIAALFVIDADAVLAFQPALAPQREDLSLAWFEAGEWFDVWERCSVVLGDSKRLKAPDDPSPRWNAVGESEAWLCLLAMPMSNGDRRALEGNRVLAPQLDPEEASGVLDLNRLRILLGLNAVTIDVKLCNAARDHSNDMRTLGFFAHESPVDGKKTPWDRAARAGTSAGAENIAAGQRTGPDANRAWWYSPGHHKNMLGGHSRVGLGRSESHWTQMFG